MKRAKNYKKLNTVMNEAKDLNSYLEIACKNNTYKFDQSIELNFGISRSSKNPQPYKVSVTYPNNFGKSAKVLVLVDDKDTDKALKAGADYAGLDEYVNKITNENWLDFDVVLATPTVMPKIAKLGRVLGTRGLMPNPKTGTVVTDVEAGVKEFKAGKRNFKEDKSGTMQTVVGKVSQGNESVLGNIKSLVASIKESTPGLFNDTSSLHIKTTMGPSLTLGLSELINL